MEVIFAPSYCPISLNGFNLNFAFDITPLDPCTFATCFVGATYNLVVGPVAFGLNIAAYCFWLSLLYTSLGSNPLKVLSLHTWISTWSSFIRVLLFKSCSASIFDCVLSLKSNEQTILFSIVCFVHLDIWAKHMLKKIGIGMWFIVPRWIGPSSHPLNLWLDTFSY